MFSSTDWFWPWMKNICSVSSQSAEESTLIPALGQMHGKLHKWPCRVSWSQNNDWFLATLNICCVSVHCNKSSWKYWLKKSEREGFESMTFAWKVWFLTQQVWSHSGGSLVYNIYTYYIIRAFIEVVTFKISCYRIELSNIITKFTIKKSHSCLRHDLSNAVISISLLYC